MSLELATTLIAAILLAGLIVRRWSENKRKKLAGKAPASPAPEDESLVDLNEKFLRLAADSSDQVRPQAKLVRSFSPADSAMLRSMLDAEGIPSYCDANTMGSLYAGVALEGFSDEIIMVFSADAAAAREIASGYIKDLRSGPGTARALPELLD